MSSSTSLFFGCDSTPHYGHSHDEWHAQRSVASSGSWADIPSHEITHMMALQSSWEGALPTVFSSQIVAPSTSSASHGVAYSAALPHIMWR